MAVNPRESPPLKLKVLASGTFCRYLMRDANREEQGRREYRRVSIISTEPLLSQEIKLLKALLTLIWQSGMSFPKGI